MWKEIEFSNKKYHPVYVLFYLLYKGSFAQFHGTVNKHFDKLKWNKRYNKTIYEYVIMLYCDSI